jgi:nucleolar protein 15
MPSKQKTSTKPSSKQKRESKKNASEKVAATANKSAEEIVILSKEDERYRDKLETSKELNAAKKKTNMKDVAVVAKEEGKKRQQKSGDFLTLEADADAEEGKKKKMKKDKKPRVIYVGSVPHGFYEDQMRDYFGQFGEVLRVKVSRNKKTGKSKHYAFVEFKHAEVASIVAESMDNYLLANHVLKVKLMKPEDVHPETFKGVTKGGFKIVPWNKRAAEQHNKKRDETGEKKRMKKLVKSEKKRREKIKAMGIEYDFDGYEKQMKELKISSTNNNNNNKSAPAKTTTMTEKEKEKVTKKKPATTKKTTTEKKVEAPAAVEKKTPAKKKKAEVVVVEKTPAATTKKTNVTVETIESEKKKDSKITPRTARRNRVENRGAKREADVEAPKGTATKRTKK